MQAKDKATWLPVWVIEVIDADPAAREKTAKVKIAAADRPALPPATAGMPFVAVEFTWLTVTPYVNLDAAMTRAIDAHIEAEQGSEDDGDDGLAGALVPAG